jgi:exodeoxyribonuclease V alpha subunit
MLTKLNKVRQQGMIRATDYYFARFMSQLEDQPSDELTLAACMVSYETSHGHTCISLDHIAGKSIFNFSISNETLDVSAPSLTGWITKLRLCQAVGHPGDNKPLILDDDNRLYLGKFWQYESYLSQDLLRRSHQVFFPASEKSRSLLNQFFPNTDQLVDWQKLAAAIALLHRFSVISGGPGTGKTTTVTKILALIIALNQNHNFKIVLAAPTGKAAARLSESVRAAKRSLNCQQSIIDAVPEDSITIHRLLGQRPFQQTFRFHQNNQLALDLLVVDEASMIDLSLMNHLVQALPAHASLILLGDKDQLTSVEAGNVLADICPPQSIDCYSTAQLDYLKKVTPSLVLTPSPVQSQIQDSIAVLKKSYRFSNESGIKLLSHAINHGKASQAITFLNDSRYNDIDFYSGNSNDRMQSLLTLTARHYSQYLNAPDIATAMQQFQQFRLLCAVKQGDAGVYEINRLIEQKLRQQRHISVTNRWYLGRPIIINENDYSLNIFNGDVGLLWPAKESDNQLRAYFLTQDNQLKKCLPNRLPAHETAYAMTIHKSQGSEFKHTAVILPDNDSSLLSRELVYTAITRAKNQLSLFSSEKILNHAIRRQSLRQSGLQAKLWKHHVH